MVKSWTYQMSVSQFKSNRKTEKYVQCKILKKHRTICHTKQAASYKQYEVHGAVHSLWSAGFGAVVKRDVEMF